MKKIKFLSVFIFLFILIGNVDAQRCRGGFGGYHGGFNRGFGYSNRVLIRPRFYSYPTQTYTRRVWIPGYWRYNPYGPYFWIPGYWRIIY